MGKVIEFRMPEDNRTPREKLDDLVKVWNSFGGKLICERTKQEMIAVAKHANGLLLQYPELVGQTINIASYNIGFEFANYAYANLQPNQPVNHVDITCTTND
jgi:hypothetical protein